MWKKSLKWGVLLGMALSFLEPVKMYARILDYEARTMFDFVMILLFILLLYFAQKDYKENLNGGFLSFSKAYGIGIVVTVTAWLIFHAYMIFHFSVVEPEAIDRIYRGEIFSPLTASMLYSLSVLLYGLLFDLFTSLYIYKKKDDAASVEQGQSEENYVESGRPAEGAENEVE